MKQPEDLRAERGARRLVSLDYVLEYPLGWPTCPPRSARVVWNPVPKNGYEKGTTKEIAYVYRGTTVTYQIHHDSCRESRHRYSADTAAAAARMRPLVLKAWLRPLVVGLSLFLGISGGSWATMHWLFAGLFKSEQQFRADLELHARGARDIAIRCWLRSRSASATHPF